MVEQHTFLIDFNKLNFFNFYNQVEGVLNLLTNINSYCINMADLKETKAKEIDTAELALRCAEFFMSLGESCLQFYHKYNKEKQRKTKLIKKAQKQRARAPKKVDGQGDELDEDLKKKLPKKPLTAYIIYFQEKKPNFVQKHPGLNLSQLTKLIAKQWKQIDNNQRKPYLAQAQQDRKRYETEMKDFKAKYGTIHENNIEEENGANQQASNSSNQNQNQNQIQNENENDNENSNQNHQLLQNKASQKDDNMEDEKQQNDEQQQQGREEENEGSEGADKVDESSEKEDNQND